MYAVSVEELTKKYGNYEVLKGVSLKIAEEEFYALMGPNGSGKTTLASIIASVRFPTSGKIEIYGKNLKMQKIRLDIFLRRTSQPPFLQARRT